MYTGVPRGRITVNKRITGRRVSVKKRPFASWAHRT